MNAYIVEQWKVVGFPNGDDPDEIVGSIVVLAKNIREVKKALPDRKFFIYYTVERLLLKTVKDLANFVRNTK